MPNWSSHNEFSSQNPIIMVTNLANQTTAAGAASLTGDQLLPDKPDGFILVTDGAFVGFVQRRWNSPCCSRTGASGPADTADEVGLGLSDIYEASVQHWPWTRRERGQIYRPRNRVSTLKQSWGTRRQLDWKPRTECDGPDCQWPLSSGSDGYRLVSDRTSLRMPLGCTAVFKKYPAATFGSLSEEACNVEPKDSSWKPIDMTMIKSQVKLVLPIHVPQEVRARCALSCPL